MKTELPWACEITKGINGYVMTHQEELDDGETREEIQVFEEPDIEAGELEAMRSLLRAVMDFFGVYYSTHNQHNLIIEIIGEDEVA